MSNTIINPYAYSILGNYTDMLLLMHMDGTDASTTFPDSGPDARGNATVFGNAQVDTGRNIFGTGALLMDGTGDYLQYASHADFNLGTGDFTISAHLYVEDIGTNAYAILSHGWSTATEGQWTFNINTSAALQFVWHGAGGATQVARSLNNTITTGVWCYVGARRDSGGVTIWKDGSDVTDQNDGIGSVSLGGAYPLDIGRSNLTNTKGSMDELRFIKGSAEDLSWIPDRPWAEGDL